MLHNLEGIGGRFLERGTVRKGILMILQGALILGEIIIILLLVSESLNASRSKLSVTIGKPLVKLHGIIQFP